MRHQLYHHTAAPNIELGSFHGILQVDVFSGFGPLSQPIEIEVPNPRRVS